MKTLLFTLIFLHTTILISSAQVLYSTTRDGGKYGGGTICKYNTATQQLNTVKSFYTDGSTPYGSLTAAANGRFYGMTAYGGAYGYGTIFSYDAATGSYKQEASFNRDNGYQPQGSLLQATDGKLYGITTYGGSDGNGVLFSCDPSTSQITKLYDFNFSDGAGTSGMLIQATDGKLYGTTNLSIFSYDLSTSTYTKLHDFTGTTDGNPNGSLMQATNGKIYGVTVNGGRNQVGTLFSYDPSTSTYTRLRNFDVDNGYEPQGGLLQASDGKLYGTTNKGGDNNYGVIYSFNPANSTYNKLFSFDANNGAGPVGTLIQATDGNLYGMTFGSIYSFNFTTSTYTKLYDFDYTTGNNPQGSLLQAPDGKLYGLTSAGGVASRGVIFSYDISTGTSNKLRDFGTSQDGNTLYGGLCKGSDGKLFGMTTYGGSYGYGVIFSYNPATDAFTKLYDFDGIDGSQPQGSLIQASDGNFYGLTRSGGIHGYGIIFSYNPSTFTYTKLYEFDGINGAWPYGSLIQTSDGKLYGMTSAGGAYGGFGHGEVGYGVIFSFDLLTLTYTDQYDLDGRNGAYPYGDLVQASDGKLYGMTREGGIINDPEDVRSSGVIFSYDPQTSTLTDLHDFERTTNRPGGGNPHGSLIQASDGKLYGMTSSGGVDGYGVILSYDPSANAYTTLYRFDHVNGGDPRASLLQASDGKLYGTTELGGTKDSGVVFSYNIAVDTNNYQKLAEFTGGNGAFPQASFIEVSTCTPKTYYRDADNDSYGNMDSAIQSCTLPQGYVADSTDCNDQDSTIHPGAPELCDGKDNNCDGRVDESCPIPKISIGDALTWEGNSGYRQMHFHVKLSTAGYDTVRVRYTTEKGTATPQQDYVPAKGTLTFMPGEKEQTITVLIKGDTKAELPELFKVQLSKPAGAAISKEDGIGIIIDDDLTLGESPITAQDGNPSDLHAITVSPNPASSLINVALNGFKGNTLIQLLSPQGKALKEVKLQLKGIGNQQLNVSDLPGGTYFISATDQQGNKQTVKLVIAH